MKILGWILVVLGVIFAFLTCDLINGNHDLDAPGNAILAGGLQGSWRFLFGFMALLAAVSLTAGAMILTKLPGLAYLALIAFFLLSIPYIALGALVPSLAVAIVLIVLFVLVIPAVVWLIAFLIGRAILKRRVPAAPTFPQQPSPLP